MTRLRLTPTHVLPRALLVFWASWFSIVFASNLMDGLWEAGLLSMDPSFRSGNFALLAEAIAVYSVSRTGAAILFSLVLIAQLMAAALFWRASREPEPHSAPAQQKVLVPFIAGTALFAGFVLFDEILVVYRRSPGLETSHLAVFSALLLSVLVIRALGR